MNASGSFEQGWHDAIAHYEAGVKGSMLADYRCRAKGCLLLRIWQTPSGPEFFAPAAGISDQHTTAGQWHWLGMNRSVADKTGDRAGRLDDIGRLQAGGWLWLLCDHINEAVWVREMREDIDGRTPGRPARIILPRRRAEAP